MLKPKKNIIPRVPHSYVPEILVDMHMSLLEEKEGATCEEW